MEIDAHSNTCTYVIDVCKDLYYQLSQAWTGFRQCKVLYHNFMRGLRNISLMSGTTYAIWATSHDSTTFLELDLIWLVHLCARISEELEEMQCTAEYVINLSRCSLTFVPGRRSSFHKQFFPLTVHKNRSKSLRMRCPDCTRTVCTSYMDWTEPKTFGVSKVEVPKDFIYRLKNRSA